jgi:hypothetical protein
VLIEDPIKALQYGAIHGCYDICDDAALRLLQRPVNHKLVARTLDWSLVATWVLTFMICFYDIHSFVSMQFLYHEQYATFLHKIREAIPEVLHRPSDYCHRWQRFQSRILSPFAGGCYPMDPKDVVYDRMYRTQLYILDKCGSCIARSMKWRDNIAAIPDLKKFSEVLRG